MAEKLPIGKIGQIGMVVKDMDKTIEYYESVGIGPFKQMKKIAFVKREFWGKPVPVDSIKSRITAAQMGPIQIELIEPVEGDSHWKRYLDTRGEGIHHFGFFVDDIDKEEAKVVEQGLDIVYSSRFDDGGGVCYFDPGRGGVLFELIDMRGEMLAQD